MDIAEFAMKMELDGKAYYEKQAAATTQPELKSILLQLAEEESRHYEYFRRLKENSGDVSGGNELKGSETLNNVKNIFDSLAQKTDNKPFGEEVVSVWRKALEIEVESEKFYKARADAEPDKEKKKFLLKIAGEENNHIQMIDNVIMYLKHPQTFIDSARYRNFRSLEGWDSDKL
jgi:rubrerythrin